MPWTESRSRDEWLAEVQRRGTRIRRRRRVGFGVVGAIALILPVSVTANVIRSGPERAIEVSVAAPEPTFRVPMPTTTIPVAVGAGGVAAAVTTEDPTPPAGASSPTTTTEVHRRVPSANGPVVGPAPPTSVPSTAALATVGPDPASGPNPAPAGRTVPPIMTLRPCMPVDVKVTVTTEKAAYAPGERISGSATLAKVSGPDCRLELVAADGTVSTHYTARILDGAGSTVSWPGYESFSSSSPVPFEPQKSYTTGFTWDQKVSGESDCAVILCLQVPAGTYTVLVG